MDIKNKLKQIIQRQGSSKSPITSPVDTEEKSLAKDPRIRRNSEKIAHDGIPEFPNDPHKDQEILESIEPAYYSDGSFDATQHELEKLPDILDLHEIHADRNRLRRQIQVVNKKISELILENQTSYEVELQRVMELQSQLQAAHHICLGSRQNLHEAKDDFTTASLGILANYRKRQQLVGLMRSLHTIKTLQRTDVRLSELLEEEDYPGAIQLCLECQQAAATFRHYSCISELSSKLQDTLEQIEEQLDVALSKTCQQFDYGHYTKVQAAYRLLGKTQTAMDQLHMHFASAIHNTAFTIVLGYVELCCGNDDTNFQKRQYQDLCKHVTQDSFSPCLVDLCQALWEVVKSYHSTMRWHEHHDAEVSDADAGTNAGNVEESVARRYIRRKLDHGRLRVWHDVQQKVRAYAQATDLSTMKFDDFIRIVDHVRRLMQIGEEFCGSDSEFLQESIRKQSVNYFRTYHRGRMEELRMFVENEGWEPCPVKASFSILHLQEFKFLRASPLLQQQQQQQGSVASVQEGSAISTSRESSPVKQRADAAAEHQQDGFFLRYLDAGNPFSVEADEDAGEDIMEHDLFENSYSLDHDDSTSDDDVPEELKQDYIEEGVTGESHAYRPLPMRCMPRRPSWKATKAPPIVTNTTLTVLRLFGKYIQMMDCLRTIAFDVTICMSQLFDFYLYAVYSFFASEMMEVNERTMSSKLRTTLRRITDNLIARDATAAAAGDPAGDRRDRVPHPHVSPIVDLSDPSRLHGLAERVAAAESLVYLATQFEFLQPCLEAVIPPQKKAFLQQFYSQTVSTATELRKPVYQIVAVHAVDYEQVHQQIAALKWEIKEIMSQHNTYVDVVLREFQVFSMRLAEVSKRVPIPKEAYNVLWEHCIRLASRTFVEGYACAKKCSNEGRALMQLDFQQFLMKLEKLTDLRPIPDRDYVEGYIKAYYLPDSVMEQWVREHKEYNSRQLSALVNCVTHLSKKSRHKIISIIEETDKARR